MKVLNKKTLQEEVKNHIDRTFKYWFSLYFHCRLMCLQPLTISARTTIFKTLFLNFNAGLDLHYWYFGRRVDTFEAKTKQTLIPFVQYGISISLTYSINNQFKKKEEGQEQGFSSLGSWNMT